MAQAGLATGKRILAENPVPSRLCGRCTEFAHAAVRFCTEYGKMKKNSMKCAKNRRPQRINDGV
jgi:hypothetical protein